MFVAEDIQGQKIWAQDCFNQQKGSWHCPNCKGQVRLKRGPLLAAHFAHVSLADDCQSFSEGETAEHLSGKMLLGRWAKGSELEAYLPELKQRPDVLWGNLAMEFQCSSLAFERFAERTEKYIKQGYAPWWILGEKFHPKQRLSDFQKACCYYEPLSGIKLWLLSERTQTIQLCYNLQWHYQKGHLYERKNFQYERQSLRRILLEKPLASTDSIWENLEFKKALAQKLLRCAEKILFLQERFYVQAAHILYLPNWCYEPSRYFFFFEEELLYLRWCVLHSNSYNQWLEQIDKILPKWPFPLISRTSILQKIYEESCLLAEIKK
ncbi:competence protein CoiA [Enterococcus sp.]|uniref:competence protein CoiA n=1 Tax=Enterococcus sp. TaxID=35783 RepID=UPI002FC9AF6C